MYIILYHCSSSVQLLFNQTATCQDGKVSACVVGFALYFALLGTSVISLMRINNHGSYLAPNNVTSHSFCVGVRHNYCFIQAVAEFFWAHYTVLAYSVLINS